MAPCCLLQSHQTSFCLSVPSLSQSLLLWQPIGCWPGTMSDFSQLLPLGAMFQSLSWLVGPLLDMEKSSPKETNPFLVPKNASRRSHSRHIYLWEWEANCPIPLVAMLGLLGCPAPKMTWVRPRDWSPIQPSPHFVFLLIQACWGPMMSCTQAWPMTTVSCYFLLCLFISDCKSNMFIVLFPTAMTNPSSPQQWYKSIKGVGVANEVL